MENKAFDFKVEDGALVMALDPNKDGEPVMKAKVHLSEALQEAMNRSEPLEGVKVVSLSFENSKLKLKLDTDKDSEPVFELELDLIEGFEEIQSALSKTANEQPE